MKNPYEVLGIREGAGPDEIKRAYKELVKKYHPDQYSNNPLSDLAEEKLKEINQAYDYLMKQQQTESQTYARSQQNGYNGYSGGGDTSRGSYDQVRSLINMGNIKAAEDILERISNRDAEWYYLAGLIFMRKGWYNEAYTNFSTAVSMDPANYEYREALNRINYTNRQYQSTAYDRRGYNNGPDLCTMCQCLWCSDCCCESMGGDLIGCC